MDADKIRGFYANDIEKNRLELELFKLEGIRTKEIISRYLTHEKISILDIGAGAGFYSFWLREKGHNVSIIDLSPRNIELINERAQKSSISFDHVEEGSALQLSFSDNKFDMLLMMGPLYHLTKREDRIKALSEAKRVLKPGGILVSAVISRYAALFDGFRRDLVKDSRFEKLLGDGLANGIHRNDTDNLEYFTTAYFHVPDDLKTEIQDSGLSFIKSIAVESFGWVIDDFENKSTDPGYMEKLLHFIKEVESKEDLIAMSPHIIAVAKKL